MTLKQSKLVYKCKQTGERFIMRRLDGITCIVKNEAAGTEEKMTIASMRKKYSYQKKESSPKRWLNDGMFY